jgi:hypothetical protein
MESWVLLIMLTRGSETVPVRVPMSGYERCMEAGHQAETLASTLKDAKVTWTCEVDRKEEAPHGGERGF